MDIVAIIAALADSLNQIQDLHAYATRPGTVNPPACVFAVDEIDYDTSFDHGSDDLIIVATVLTQMASDRGEAQLYGYMDVAGDQSIPAAIQADPTLGQTVQFAVVRRVRAPGIATYGGVDFYAASFEIVVGV